MERREFIKKLGIASVAALSLYVAPTIETVKGGGLYSQLTSYENPPATPSPTSTPVSNPGAIPGDKIQNTPNVSYYTWNVIDECYYRVHYGDRQLIYCPDVKKLGYKPWE